MSKLPPKDIYPSWRANEVGKRVDRVVRVIVYATLALVMVFTFSVALANPVWYAVYQQGYVKGGQETTDGPEFTPMESAEACRLHTNTRYYKITDGEVIVAERKEKIPGGNGTFLTLALQTNLPDEYIVYTLGCALINEDK